MSAWYRLAGPVLPSARAGRHDLATRCAAWVTGPPAGRVSLCGSLRGSGQGLVPKGTSCRRALATRVPSTAASASPDRAPPSVGQSSRLQRPVLQAERSGVRSRLSAGIHLNRSLLPLPPVKHGAFVTCRDRPPWKPGSPHRAAAYGDAAFQGPAAGPAAPVKQDGSRPPRRMGTLALQGGACFVPAMVGRPRRPAGAQT
jgi:hypothetical protein